MKGYRYIISLCLCLLLISCEKADNKVEALAFKMNATSAWGLISTDGKPLDGAGTYGSQPSSVVNGMYSVPDGKGLFLLYNIDTPRRPVCSRHFYRIGYFFEDVTLAQTAAEAPFILIDKQGNTVATLEYPQYNIVLAHNFSQGRALVGTSDGKYGYIDTEGNIVIPPLYSYAADFSEGKALVGLAATDGETTYQVIDTKGRALFTVGQSRVVLDKHYACGMLMYSDIDGSHCAYMDSRGNTILNLADNVRDSYAFEHHYAVFTTDTGMGIVDGKGKVCVPDRYADAFVAGRGIAAVMTSAGRWTVTPIGTEPTWKYVYDRIGRYYPSGLSVASRAGRSMMIDRTGKPTSASYAVIADDVTASHLAPEVFLCSSHTAGASFPQEGTSHLSAMKTDSTSVRPLAVKMRPAPVPHAVSNNSNWRAISRQSPFYSEAAKVLSGRLTETDAESRRVILNYVEHLRTSYTTKDIDFLNQLFSENALIIVGHVIRTSNERNTGYLSPSQVSFNVHSKQEYLAKLRLVFKANKSISVRFSNFHIMRHPTVPGIYGVSLRQSYQSDRYSDDGYLFLLWDFRDVTAPKIYVRTWQPSMMDDRTPLPEESVFNIRNFNLQ
jgi:hypothetical protein